MGEIRKVTKEEWIDALWSGDYRQHRGGLRSREGDAFCCLGVLADLAGAEWTGCGLSAYSVENYLPISVRHAIGLDWLTGPVQDELAQLNDRQRKSFREIGEYLKELPW